MSPSSVLVPDAAEMAVRIGAALLVGAVLGIDRDLHRKPAGVRTHALVSIGSAAVIMLVLIGANGNGDSMSRAVQGLVAGVGFLGAGVIIHHEAERRVEGLTTAASIWVAAALGMVCGAGLGVLTALALGATLLVLLFGGPLERALEKRVLKGNAPPARD
ncbi:MAG TPA: MgtC/SapB family protein [Usitatibacter sp.]|nr:MgtC/SapB family protein [Usitatibacter sp.]